MTNKAKAIASVVKDWGPDAVFVVAGAIGGWMGFGSSTTNFAHLPGTGASLGNAMRDLFTGSSSFPNPLFWLNGFEEEESPLTDTYLRHRTWKKYGGGVYSTLGLAVSPFTSGTNPLAMSRHASSEVATLIHLYKLAALKNNFKSSDTVCGWIELVVKMKVMKAVSQGAQLAINALPTSIAAVGATAAALGSGASIASKIAAKSMGGTCAATAMQLHWRAYRELKISPTGRGPATLIVKELFSRRHYTLLGGSYDYKAMLMEPGGWKAIEDKLLLL